ncbi:MAG: ATP-binding protein [Caulobacteraceae bacterium]|nr:ATP-binding protein [Caulobacteraceae bacterium]
MKQAILSRLYPDDRVKAAIAERLDEAAATFHPLWPQRAVVALVILVVTIQLCPIWVSILWTFVSIILAIWGWFSTKKQFDQEYIEPATRMNFVYSLVAMFSSACILSIFFITTGTLLGQLCGGVALATLISLLIVLFDATPVIFVVAGVLPSLLALLLLMTRDQLGLTIIVPFGIFLFLCLGFILKRASDRPSSRETQRRLEETLVSYKLLTDNITDFIGKTDLDGVYQYASPSVYTVLGYRPEELIGTRIQDLLEADSSNFEFSGQNDTVAHPDAKMTVTLRVRHKLGHWVWLQTSAKLVVENGLPVGLIGASRDVTESVSSDLALRAAKAEAEAANRAKDAFLANMSHEIRTPMNAVLGALHLLDQEPISHNGRHLVDQALVCGDMLTQIVNDILDFSKIEAGELSLSTAPMNVSQALDGVIALLSPQAVQKGIDLRSNVVGEQCWVDADAVRVRQAMFNLIGNAVKFTNEGSVTATLSFLASSHLDHCLIRLEVQDTGIGIPDTLRPQLFQRFQQGASKASIDTNGTGLGLAISKALIDLMGGEIDYSSVEGLGSRFWMEFEVPRAEPVQAIKFANHELSGVRVLLVEDNSTNRLMARTMLTSLGAVVTEADNGLAGLDAVISETFDVVLMDVQMPIMDGVAATRAIRALAEPKANIPIIGLTANAMAHQRSEYEQAGMSGIVSKPISPVSLISEVIKQLNR